MKCSDFSALFRKFADILDVAGAAVAREKVLMFATIFDVRPQSSISDLVKLIASLPNSESTGRPSLGDVCQLLTTLKISLDKTAKAAVLTDLAHIEKLSYDRASMEIAAIVSMTASASASRRSAGRRDKPAMRNDLVVHYKERLESALGDEEKFATVYNDLRADKAIGKSEVIALAKEMTGSGARTEDAALKKIWSRQEALMVFKAKRRATGGRSAA